MKYRVDPNYRPILQLPYCCVPATLQWILYRHRLDILDQESIGAELGLRLPVKGKTLFRNRRIRFVPTVPKEGYGTQIEKERYSIKRFLSKNNIALEISDIFLPRTKRELEKFLREELTAGHDIILRYNNQIFKRAGEKSYGHFSVVAGFDNRTERVTIGDPEMPHFKTASLEQILYSMSERIDGIRRGLYIVRLK